MASFSRLVRYADGGQTFYGDLIRTENGQYSVKKFLGDVFSLQPTDDIVKVKEVCTTKNAGHSVTTSTDRTTQLLCPIEKTPLVLCIGLNYKTHAEEAKVYMLACHS